MKSWADHCSSDEESLDDLPEQVESQKLAEVEPVDPTTDGPPPATTEDEVDGPAAEDAPPAAPRTYDFPDKPPFTAFIGNLAYSLKEPDDLIAAVKQCALEVLGQDINFLGARISFGRDGAHRGFGYLEVETLDELKLLMQLNDGTGTIAGRKVQLDTANGNQNKRGSHQRRQQGDSNVDGSRFRGGKYNNNRRNNNNSNKEEGPPKERPSLKLAPRTKPKAEDEKGEAQGSSEIFGGAKARDAQAWEENRKPSRQHNGDNQQRNDGDRRRSNQIARGGGRGGRTGGRGNAISSNNNSNSESSGKRAPQGKREPKQKLISPEEKAAAAAAKAEVAAPAAAAPAKPAAPTNKFALLMDSDSD